MVFNKNTAICLFYDTIEYQYLLNTYNYCCIFKENFILLQNSQLDQIKSHELKIKSVWKLDVCTIGCMYYKHPKAVSSFCN